MGGKRHPRRKNRAVGRSLSSLAAIRDAIRAHRRRTARRRTGHFGVGEARPTRCVAILAVETIRPREGLTGWSAWTLSRLYGSITVLSMS